MNEITEPIIIPRDEHQLSRKDIDPDVLKIMRRLIRYGFKAYLVGGGVRDLLLGKAPKDFDVATDANPRRIKSLFRNCRIIGRRFKLAHLYFRGGKIIEVSTFRDTSAEPEPEETEEKSDDLMITRDNIYGDERTDAVRRDLTINALFYDLSTFSIIDYVGGMQDLKDRIIRIIGDPDIRFAEDPVRMMRVVRHAARAEFRIEEQCLQSIVRNSRLIEKCSNVRVYEELKKDLTSGYALKILQLLSKVTLLSHLIPELEANDNILLWEESYFAKSLARADAYFNSQKGDHLTPVLCLIALFIGEKDAPARELSERFQSLEELDQFLAATFSNLAVPRKERERIQHVAQAWWALLRESEQRPAEQLHRHGQIGDLSLLLQFLNSDGQYDSQIDLLTEIESTPTNRHERDTRSRPRQRQRRGIRRPRMAR